MSEKEKYEGLPHVEPDPKLQLQSWSRTGTFNPPSHLISFYANVRRAFVQAMVARYHIRTAEEIRELVRRRFGAAPSLETITVDLRQLGIIRVPIPGGGTQLKLISQINNVNLEQEVDERFRIDVLNVQRQGSTIMIETNRGTAQSVVQLMNLVVDDGSRNGLLAVTSDGDKWVVLHMEDAKQATKWQTWLSGKLY